MGKLWLTDRRYHLLGYLLRIVYWLVAIYISSLYLQHYAADEWFKLGLMLLSLFFVVGFLVLARLLDHVFKIVKN
ncbi:hypothetical protein [Psychromonas sp. MME2]|uniref:hypothetical protein n=1 Tax=unclassified Psychromonas TaxID=2614957 RepID=UPI00339BD532